MSTNKDYSEVERRLLKLLKVHAFSNIDTIDLVISYPTFVDKGAIRCKKAIGDLSQLLQKLLSECKYPGLNPIIDEIYDLKMEEMSGLESIYKFIEERASFEASSIDNKKDMVDISVPICIILANVTDFIEEERIKIMKAEVQTALFKKEI